jgi:division protein CdvB (Snf7/Vps24/ESCRT-III family)
MKYQKARSVVHQHNVAWEKVQELKLTRDQARREVEAFSSAPDQTKRLLETYGVMLREIEEQLADLNTSRDLLLGKIREREAELKSPPAKGQKVAEETLRQAEAKLSAAEKVMERWAKDLGEARKVIDGVHAREAKFQEDVEEEVKKILPEFAASKGLSVRELAERNVREAYGRQTVPEQERASGKRNSRARYDSMGNKPPARLPSTCHVHGPDCVHG